MELPPLSPADLRWQATPLRLEEWQEWFKVQLIFASKVGEGRREGAAVMAVVIFSLSPSDTDLWTHTLALTSSSPHTACRPLRKRDCSWGCG